MQITSTQQLEKTAFKTHSLISPNRLFKHSPPPQVQDRLALSRHSRHIQRTTPLDPLYGQANIHLDLQDINGITNFAKNDINGKINGQITINKDTFYKHIQSLKGTKSKDGHTDVEIKDVFFNPQNRSYDFKIKTRLLWGALWDNFNVHLQSNPQGQFHLALKKSWLPDKQVLEAIKGQIKTMVKEQLNKGIEQVDVDIKMHRKGNKLFFTPVIHRIDIPLGDMIPPLQINNIKGLDGYFNIAPQGHVNMSFNRLGFVGSTDPNGKIATPQKTADQVRLGIIGQMYRDGNVNVQTKGTLNIDLNEEEVEELGMLGLPLNQYVERIGLQANIDATVKLDPYLNIKVESNNSLHLNNTRIQGRNYNMSMSNMGINLDTSRGMNVDIKQPLPIGTYRPDLTQNTVEPIIDGPAYFQEMMRAVQNARESIELETFLYYAGDTTRQLTRQLALKAVGLIPSAGNQPIPDRVAPNGVNVHVLFNHKLTTKGAKPAIKMFTDAKAQLQSEIQAMAISPEQKSLYLQRLETNLSWQLLAQGVAKADHRKLLIIDGKTGYTGGINMGDHFLKQDSYHDIMLKINGPAVREMGQEFIENWSDFGGHPNQQWNLKSIEQLNQHRDRYAAINGLTASQSDIILTDDHSSEIESAMLQMLNSATKEINLEHAYFYHPPTFNALKNALTRGVTLNIMIPNRSDEKIFNLPNTDNIRQLMELQKQLGKGQVNAWLYTGRGGRKSHMAHTKAMSVDGQAAIIGSANLTKRSLQSAFKQNLPGGGQKNTLFNEEIALYINDPKKVQELNHKLFIADRNLATKVDYKAIMKRFNDLGGEQALIMDVLQAQLA